MKSLHLMVNRIWPPRKVPFTLIISGLLLLAAILTGSWHKPLSTAWQEALGFAPRDLIRLDWIRIFTSALVTSGGIGFWLPMGALIGLSLIAETLSNSGRAALAFCLPHVGSTIGGSLLVWLSIKFFHSNLLNNIYVGRDIGPSAGYFGCMGLIVYRFPRPWNYLSGFAILAGLTGSILNSAQRGAFIDVSAGLSHLVAFPLGWYTEVFLSATNRAHNHG